MSQLTAGPPVARRTNGQAIASLVLGILGITGPAFVIGPILALVFGYGGRTQIDRSGGAEDGRSLAVAGIVLGWVGVALVVVFAVVGILFAVWGHSAMHVMRIGRSVTGRSVTFHGG